MSQQQPTKIVRVIGLGLLICIGAACIPFAAIFLASVLGGCVLSVGIVMGAVVEWFIRDVTPENSQVALLMNGFRMLVAYNDIGYRAPFSGSTVGTVLANFLVAAGFVAGILVMVALPFVWAYSIVYATEWERQKLPTTTKTVVTSRGGSHTTTAKKNQ